MCGLCQCEPSILKQCGLGDQKEFCQNDKNSKNNFIFLVKFGIVSTFYA
ncbi:hypothetical protein [Moraxella lacunata]